MEYVSSIERIKLAQARQGGLQEGEAAMLSRLLTQRFNSLPEAVQTQVNNASREQIQAWFDLAVKATTLDGVFQDLSH